MLSADDRALFYAAVWLIVLGITIVVPPVGLAAGVVVLVCEWRTRRRS